MGLLRVPFLPREKRLDLARVPRGPAWAFPMGMAFAVGWTPCIGPALATIVATASASGTAVQEIGQAACRESEGPNVSLKGVRGTLKKNEITNPIHKYQQ